MIEIWRKNSGEWAAKLGSGAIVSAPDAAKLFAKFERAGISSQPVRLIADDAFTQWQDFSSALRGIGGKPA